MARLPEAAYTIRNTFIELDEGEEDKAFSCSKRRARSLDCSWRWESSSTCDDNASDAPTSASDRCSLGRQNSFDNVSIATDSEYSPFSQDSDADVPSNVLAPPVSSDSDSTPEAKMCRFGAECFSKRCRFAHPSADGVPRPNVNRTRFAARPCKHGASCFNFSLEHRERFKHPEVEVPMQPTMPLQHQVHVPPVYMFERY